MNFFSTRNFYLFVLTICILLLNQSCDSTPPPLQNEITPNDDAAIGKTIDDAFLAHIDTSPSISYLSPVKYAAAYNYINQIKENISQSSCFTELSSQPKSSIHTPTIRILDQSDNTGAFVVPGGYIYLYKDFLNVLNQEAQFAPVLAHLMACSKKRYDIQKLEAQFSTNFLLDLALGATINNSSSTDIHAIINTLENIPYSTEVVEVLDKEAEKTACELDYDVQTYSNLFIQNNSLQATKIKWCQQFPRNVSLSSYASYLFNDVKDSLSCNGQIKEGGYSQFKTLLN